MHSTRVPDPAPSQAPRRAACVAAIAFRLQASFRQWRHDAQPFAAAPHAGRICCIGWSFADVCGCAGFSSELERPEMPPTSTCRHNCRRDTPANRLVTACATLMPGHPLGVLCIPLPVLLMLVERPFEATWSGRANDAMLPKYPNSDWPWSSRDHPALSSFRRIGRLFPALARTLSRIACPTLRRAGPRSKVWSCR